MDGPRIAIIGSPWLRDDRGERIVGPEGEAHEEKVRAACLELGRELARRGCRLIVYSAEEHSIEPDVVRGFVSVTKARHSIEFRHPLGVAGVFQEQGLPEETVNDQADGTNDWVASFYRSLKDANGVLLVGGRNTVNIAGHVSMAFERPVAAVAVFGGAAADVWRELKHVGGLMDAEHHAMGNAWSPSLAKPIIESLMRRHGLVAEKEAAHVAQAAVFARLLAGEAARKRGQRSVLVTGGALVALLVVLVLGLNVETTGKTFLSLFVGALSLSGILGAGLRLFRNPTEESPEKSFIAGAAAGLMFSLMYLGPQLVGDHSLLTGTAMTATIRWQILVATALAISGGLAADAVIGAFQRRGEDGAVKAAQLSLVPPAQTTAPTGGNGKADSGRRARPRADVRSRS